MQWFLSSASWLLRSGGFIFVAVSDDFQMCELTWLFFPRLVNRLLETFTAEQAVDPKVFFPIFSLSVFEVGVG